MSRDGDLIVTCRCGCVEIVKRGGYETENLKDVAFLGGAAATICKHKRFRRVLWRWLLVACLAGVTVTAWVDGVRRGKVEEAAAFCRMGERKLQAQDDRGAVEEFTKALEKRVEVRTLLYRSFCYWRLCDYRAALADADAALKIEPGNEAAQANRKLFRDTIIFPHK